MTDKELEAALRAARDEIDRQLDAELAADPQRDERLIALILERDNHMRHFNPDHVYTTDLLITSIALRLGRPVEQEIVETYRGMANEYRVRDGGTVSVTFWFGVPSGTQTGKERCVLVGERGTDTERCLTLAEAIEYIVSSPWAKSLDI